MADKRSKTPPEERDEARTPPYLWHYVQARWAPEVDLASNEVNALVRKPDWEFVDSLTLDWHKLARVGYCNPPYSNLWPWLEKAIVEQWMGFTSVFCIPTLNGDSQDLLKLSANEIVHIVGRVNFLRPLDTKVPELGMEMKGNPRGTGLFVYEGGKPTGSTYSPRLTYVLRDDMRRQYRDEK